MTDKVEIDPLTGSPIVTKLTTLPSPSISPIHPPIQSVSDINKEPANKGLDTKDIPAKSESFKEVIKPEIKEVIIEKEVEVPHLAINTPEKLNRITGVLKDGGMDSASQIKSIQRIQEILGW